MSGKLHKRDSADFTFCVSKIFHQNCFRAYESICQKRKSIFFVPHRQKEAPARVLFSTRSTLWVGEILLHSMNTFASTGGFHFHYCDSRNIAHLPHGKHFTTSASEIFHSNARCGSNPFVSNANPSLSYPIDTKKPRLSTGQMWLFSDEVFRLRGA